MDSEMRFWIQTAVLSGLIAHHLKLAWQIRTIALDCKHLVEMHHEPDKYNFGTGEQTDAINDMAERISELIYFIKHFIKVQSGEEPPPPEPKQETSKIGKKR